MKKYLVSIIIPVYNAERFLAAAVDSVLAQTSKAWELILVNDGSTDQSGAICDRYVSQHENCIRVFHQDKKGIKIACNVGLNVARGEFVTFMGANDFVIPEYVELLCMKQKEVGADMVGAGYVRITPFMKSMVQKVFYRDEIYTADNMHYFLGKHKEFFFTVWGKIFRKSLIDEYRIEFGGGQKSDDEKLFICSYAAVCKKVASVSPIVYYRWWDERVTQESDSYCLGIGSQCYESFNRFINKYKINTKFATAALNYFV